MTTVPENSVDNQVAEHRGTAARDDRPPFALLANEAGIDPAG